MAPQQKTEPQADSSQQESVELSIEERSMLDTMQAEMMGLQGQFNGALRMIAATRKLEGNWTISPDRSRLMKAGGNG